MDNLSSFKKKIFVCELFFISILALTGVILLAVVPSKDEHSSSVANVSGKDSSENVPVDAIPVVVLSDGKTSQVVSLSDFLKLTQNSKVDAVIPAAQIGNMTNLVRLQNDMAKGDAEIKLLEKIVTKMDKKDEKKPQDSWWKEGWREAIKLPKDFLRSSGVFLMKSLVGGTICGLMCIAGVWVGYKFIVLPAYCASGMSTIPWVFSYIPLLKQFIHPSLYEVCNDYYVAPIASPVASHAQLNMLDCNCAADFLSAQCVGKCFPG